MFFLSLTLMEDLMSVLHFVLFLHTITQIYIRFTRFFSLSYNLTSQGKLKQISWRAPRISEFPHSANLGKRARTRVHSLL